MHNNFSWNTLADTIWIDQPVGAYSMSTILRKAQQKLVLTLGVPWCFFIRCHRHRLLDSGLNWLRYVHTFYAAMNDT